jgi:enoyl-CoA hydratase/carnithine racemase
VPKLEDTTWAQNDTAIVQFESSLTMIHGFCERVIIISGSGRAFCSGVDLTAAEDVFKGDVKDIESDPVSQMDRARKPIIGAIGGFAVAAGFEIALACDILVAAKGAKFVDAHARLVIAQALLFPFHLFYYLIIF